MAQGESPKSADAKFAEKARKLGQLERLKVEPHVLVPARSRPGPPPWRTNMVTTVFWIGEGGKSSARGGAILDGTSWKITVVPDEVSAKSGAARFEDTISFADGKFSSASLASKGFKPAKYRGDFEEREAEFDLEQQSESQGIVIWIGEIRGGRMAGRLQWKKKDGTNLAFNFTGAKASP